MHNGMPFGVIAIMKELTLFPPNEDKCDTRRKKNTKGVRERNCPLNTVSMEIIKKTMKCAKLSF